MKRNKLEIYSLAFFRLLDHLDKHNVFSSFLLALAGMIVAVHYPNEIATIIGAFK